MNAVRKIIGLLIILFIGIPVLFGIIVAVGMTQAVVSPEFYDKMPKEIIARVPDLADDIVYASREDATLDSNSRSWLQAMAAVSTKPHQVLASMGLLDWMEGELTRSLNQVGKILRGEAPLRPVRLDMRPLKQALQHDSFRQYLADVMAKLPPCTEGEARTWEEAARTANRSEDLPACRPAPESTSLLAERISRDAARDIPDDVDLFQIEGNFSRRMDMDIAKAITSVTSLLFLIPALFIALGALIAARSRNSFLRWFGASTGIGGLLGLGFALLIKRFIPLAIYSTEFHYGSTLNQLRGAACERVGELVSILGQHLLAPVVTVAEIVCVVGLVIFALSYVFNETHHAPVAPPPAA
jgi:hypothetical protein